MASFRKRIAAVLLGSIVSLGGTAQVLAQTPDAVRGEPAAREPNVRELPVDLDRIRRGLARQARTTETRDGLRLAYYVEVYGTAPRLQLFTPGENIAASPVMYGGMTHQEFLDVVTPQEFRSPAADIPGAIAALVKWAVEKRKNSEKTDK